MSANQRKAQLYCLKQTGRLRGTFESEVSRCPRGNTVNTSKDCKIGVGGCTVKHYPTFLKITFCYFLFVLALVYEDLNYVQILFNKSCMVQKKLLKRCPNLSKLKQTTAKTSNGEINGSGLSGSHILTSGGTC